MRTIGLKRWLSSSVLFLAAASQSAAASWSFTGTLEQARLYATGTVLPNGEVLVVGGSYRGTFVQYGLTSAELWNPSTGTSSFTGSLNTGRYSHTATLLNNGTVLVVGGLDNSTRLSSAELYDPSTGRFTVTGGEHSVRSGASVTLLGNGTVLFAGGYGTQYLSSAEIYDTSTGTFTVIAGSLNTPRAGQSGTMLSNGKVLIAGGSTAPDTSRAPSSTILPPELSPLPVACTHHARRTVRPRSRAERSCSRPEKTVRPTAVTWAVRNSTIPRRGSS